MIHLPKMRMSQRLIPRNTRKKYDHVFVMVGLNRDYLGPTPLFNGREFDTMFCISRQQFQRLLEDIGNADIAFFTRITDHLGKVGASMEACLLLPLKTMAYGVPPHAFRDQFHMLRSLARKCCVEFDETINQLYTKEYLHLPTKDDLVTID